MKNIAIYWGAFNPPTIWHFEVIEKLLVSQKVEKIIFTPDWQRVDKDYKIQREKREKILQIFFEELREKWLNVEFEDYFLKSDWNTTTIEVEEYFSLKLWFSPFHIFWIDTISSMPNWVWNRDKYLENELKKIFINRKWFQIPEKIDMQNYQIYDLSILEISSTIVREMIKNKIKVDEILTPKVNQNIQENWLYI